MVPLDTPEVVVSVPGNGDYLSFNEHWFLDSVVGLVHAKDVLTALAAGRTPDLRDLARPPLLVPDTQPVSKLIVRFQEHGSHGAVVVDEHGAAAGMAFPEDALEEIVGPLHDEFDDAPEAKAVTAAGVVEMDGSLPLPEAASLLGTEGLGTESDTIGGYVVATLGRLAEESDPVTAGDYRGTVVAVSDRRVERLRFELAKGGDPSGAVTPPTESSGPAAEST